jgi:hypothetical protein
LALILVYDLDGNVHIVYDKGGKLSVDTNFKVEFETYDTGDSCRIWRMKFDSNLWIDKCEIALEIKKPSVPGLVIDSTGTLYLRSSSSNKLFEIKVNDDGVLSTAQASLNLTTSLPI